MRTMLRPGAVRISVATWFSRSSWTSTRDSHLADTVGQVTRQCSRPTCAAPATSTLTYQYGERAVWVDDLTEDRDPHGYDLCDLHTQRLKVPAGWVLFDRRAALSQPSLLAG